MRYPGEVRGGLDLGGVLRHEDEEFAKDFLVQRVDLVILVADLTGTRGIAVLERFQAGKHHIFCDLRHLFDACVGHQRRLIRHHESDACDAFGVVAHALEVDDDVEDGCDGSQVARERLLCGDQFEARLLDLVTLIVNLDVVIDDLVG